MDRACIYSVFGNHLYNNQDTMTIGSHRKLLQETYMGNNEKYNYNHVGFIYFF